MANNLLKNEKDTLLDLFSKKNFEKVINLGKKLLIKYDQEIFIYNIIALSQSKLGRTIDAINTLKIAINHSPKSSDLHFNLANLFIESKENSTAKKYYLKAYQLNEKNINALYNLASIYHLEKNITKAKEYYNKILYQEPENHKTHNNLSNLYSSIGSFKKALKHIKEAINLNQKSDIYYINQSTIYRELDQVSEAIDSCKKALALNQSNNKALYNLAIFYQEKGDNKNAKEYFKKAKIDDSDERYLFYLYKEGDIKEFNKSFKKIQSEIKHSSLLQALANHNFYVNNDDLDYNFCKRGMNYIYKNKINNLNLQSDLYKISDSFLNKNKSQKLIKNGYQSGGNIFLENIDSIKYLKEIILNELKKYKKIYNNKKDLLFLDWPEQYNLKGWFVEINSNGYLKPHIHEKGWVSGSYYIKMPKKNNDNEGAICFGYDNDDFLKKITNKEEKIINLEEGDIILFPSSLYHKTIPFKEDEKRICIAFDMDLGN